MMPALSLVGAQLGAQMDGLLERVAELKQLPPLTTLSEAEAERERVEEMTRILARNQVERERSMELLAYLKEQRKKENDLAKAALDAEWGYPQGGDGEN